MPMENQLAHAITQTYGRETHFIPNGVNRPQIREASLITDKFGLKKDSWKIKQKLL